MIMRSYQWRKIPLHAGLVAPWRPLRRPSHCTPFPGPNFATTMCNATQTVFGEGPASAVAMFIGEQPGDREDRACRPWRQAEVQVVQPRAIICLGATAAQALMDSKFRITRQRGKIHRHEWADWLIATLHPSALLRMPDPVRKQLARDDFRHDMELVAKHLSEIGTK